MNERYHKTRLVDVVNLAAPHTWPGSVIPATIAMAISFHRVGTLDPLMVICFYVAVILMQSAVNAFDDYSDFVKGTDTLENSPDASDAVIVYGLDPRAAYRIGVWFLVVALIPAAYIVWKGGIVPLVIGAIGTLVLSWYAFGKHPLSYLPLGEVFCGFVMGGLIPLTGVYLQTGVLDYFVLVEALPSMFGMAINMFSNNGCDIARDLPAGRKTLACVVGQEWTDRLYRILLIVWVLSPAVVLAAQGRWIGVLIYVLECLAFTHLVSRQFRRQLGPAERDAVMTGATTLVSLVGLSYCVAMLVS